MCDIVVVHNLRNRKLPLYCHKQSAHVLRFFNSWKFFVAEKSMAPSSPRPTWSNASSPGCLGRVSVRLRPQYPRKHSWARVFAVFQEKEHNLFIEHFRHVPFALSPPILTFRELSGGIWAPDELNWIVSRVFGARCTATVFRTALRRVWWFYRLRFWLCQSHSEAYIGNDGHIIWELFHVSCSHSCERQPCVFLWSSARSSLNGVLCHWNRRRWSFSLSPYSLLVIGFGQSEIYSTACHCAFICEIMFHMKKVMTFASGCIPICLCSFYLLMDFLQRSSEIGTPCKQPEWREGVARPMLQSLGVEVLVV